MTLVITTLGISAFGMMLMLYIKMHEAQSGRYHILPTLREAGDRIARKIAGWFRWMGKVVSNRKFWLALGTFLMVEFRENVLKHEAVVKTTKKVSDAVQGRKQINTQGSVSFYLRDVSEYKDGEEVPENLQKDQ